MKTTILTAVLFAAIALPISSPAQNMTDKAPMNQQQSYVPTMKIGGGMRMSTAVFNSIGQNDDLAGGAFMTVEFGMTEQYSLQLIAGIGYEEHITNREMPSAMGDYEYVGAIVKYNLIGNLSIGAGSMIIYDGNQRQSSAEHFTTTPENSEPFKIAAIVTASYAIELFGPIELEPSIGYDFLLDPKGNIQTSDSFNTLNGKVALNITF